MSDYNYIKITPLNPEKVESNILVIYTGGTLGMVKNEKGALVPMNFNQILDRMPELQLMEVCLSVVSFKNTIDSSDISPKHWGEMAKIIEDNYDTYDGFVVLHGTDTMAYSASALSFMFTGLTKPIIFTGAQLPIGEKRTDARANFITAIEIASAKENGKSIVPEVAVCFEFNLFRGNRVHKERSDLFSAFRTENYPVLAKAGITIEFNKKFILPHPVVQNIEVNYAFEHNIAVFRIFPGMTKASLESVLRTEGLKALVIESYGQGNVPTALWFIELLKKAISEGLIVINVSQCSGGTVIHGNYATSSSLDDIGVISGKDISIEAALTKIMYLLGQYKDREIVVKKLDVPLAGEITSVL